MWYDDGAVMGSTFIDWKKFREEERKNLMPSKSPAQARLMAAAAHTKGGYDGVPQKVGKEFNQADKGGKLLSKAMHKPHKSGRKK
jgi:hypothetical protein